MRKYIISPLLILGVTFTMDCRSSASMHSTNRVNILGVGITPLDLPSAVSRVFSLLDSGARGYICATGMHGIMEAQNDPALCDIQNNSLITTPDGIPTVWLGRLDGYRAMRQVRGPDLMLQVCKASSVLGTRHFLYGGKPGVANLLRNILEIRYPGINIVGTYSPPFRPLTPDEDSDLCCRIERLKPDILWCGISTPKQERFMAQYIHTLPVQLMIGVGAAFDLNAGLLKDSPVWVRKCGLQWAHRLMQEPRRLWRRYLLNIPWFLYLCVLQRTHLRYYNLPPEGEVSFQQRAGEATCLKSNPIESTTDDLGDVAA